MKSLVVRCLGLVLVMQPAAQCVLAAELEPTPAQLEFFEKQIRPLLVAHCYKCHSAKKQEGGLRLDSRTAILAGGETEPAIVSGKPDESLLISAINYGEPYQMPPKSKLPDQKIALLTRWVKMGAPWPKERTTEVASKPKFDLAARRAKHWAWRPLGKPSPPEIERSAWPANTVDRFVLANLEEHGLTPADAADRRSLIRRVTFDLIGLPPSLEEVDDFLADQSLMAFEKVVDRLLASPHFGERWARHWMDLVRYAETHGHEFDYPIHHAFRYRDYLIRAFNADVPYDQFVIEHVAGDLIPKPRMHPVEGYNESIIATGFWFLGEATHAPVDVRGDEAGRIDNQIDVWSKTFLGLTVACARCHDHKFDAISTADYYAMAGYLQSSRRQFARLDPGGKRSLAFVHAERLYKRGVETLTKAIGQPNAENIAVIDRSLRSLPKSELPRSGNARDEVTPSTSVENETEQVFADFESANFDGWFLTGAAFGSGPTRTGDWDVRSEKPRLLEPGVAHSGRLSGKAQGVLRSPTFTIEHPFIHYRLAGQGGRIRVIVDGFVMDAFSALLFEGFRFSVDTKGAWKWHTQNVSKYVGHRAHIEIIDDGDGFVAVDEIRFASSADSQESTTTVGSSEGSDIGGSDDSKNFRKLIAQLQESLGRFHNGACDRRDVRLVNWALGREIFAAKQNEQPLADRLAGLKQQIESVATTSASAPVVLAMADGTGEDERLHIRGNHKTLGEPVTRRFLESLNGTAHPLAGDGSGRLELADRMGDGENPLLPRVIVNRLWHHLFGRGIVASVDNFGVLGQPPSHPLLLEYLAGRLIEYDWSLKRLIREMVLSSAYRMSSQGGGPDDAADPHNRWIHRASIRRLEGEAIRDGILSISGRMDETMFGRSVPVHLTPFMEGRGRPKQNGPRDGAGRRSVYVEVRRNFLPPLMLAFDTPIPFSSVGGRSVSNVPAQALILLNDAFVIEQSRIWARRVLAERGLTNEERIDALYRSAFARAATTKERAAALEFLARQSKLRDLTVKRRQFPEPVWADLCHVLLNVKELIFVR